MTIEKVLFQLFYLNSMQENHISKIEEFLDEELGQNSWFEYEISEVDSDDSETSFEVKFTTGEKGTKYIQMKTDGEKIEIDMNEDSWEEIASHNWTVKYFWMALLNWSI